MEYKKLFKASYQGAQSKLKDNKEINEGIVNAATFRELLQAEMTFLEDNDISSEEWGDLKEVYVNISDHINKSNQSWDDIIEELEREYKYAEYAKKGIRFSRTGESAFEDYKNVFNNIPIEHLVGLLAKFSATANYSENVNFLNFQIYNGPQTVSKKQSGSPSRKEQAMAFYYLLKAAGVKVDQIEKSKMASFLHFLSGENEPERMDSSPLNKQFKLLHEANYKRHNQVILNVVEKMKPIGEQDESGLFKKAIILLNKEKKFKS